MKKYFLLTAAAISLAACTNDDNLADEPVALKVSATISGNDASRAADTSWAEGDAIGITFGDRYTNIRYSTESNSGKFTGDAMYFRNKTEQVSLTAYYPFSGTNGEEPDVMEASTLAELQTPEEQAKFDFLFAGPESVSGAAPDVTLAFVHKMSKLTLIFKNGNDGTDVRKITSYTIEGLKLDGSFNPVTGDCGANADAEAKPITINTESVAHETALPSLLLFPQEVDKLTLKIKDSEDQDYKCELNLQNLALESGNNYSFTITVKKTTISVNSSIVDWQPFEGDLKGEAISDDDE